MENNKKRYLELRSKLANIALELSEVWEELDDENNDYGSKKYPFNNSFDEIAADILRWSQTKPE